MRRLGWLLAVILLSLSAMMAATGYGLFFGIGLYLLVCVPLIWYLTAFEQSIYGSKAARELLRVFLVYLPSAAMMAIWVSDGLKQSERKREQFNKVAALNPDEYIEITLFYPKQPQTLALKIPRCFLPSRQQYAHDFELLYFDKDAFEQGEFSCPSFSRHFGETANYLHTGSSVMVSLEAMPAFRYDRLDDFIYAFSGSAVNERWRQAEYVDEKNGWHKYTVGQSVGLLKVSQGNFIFIQYEPDNPSVEFMQIDMSLQKPEFMFGVVMEHRKNRSEVKDFVQGVVQKREIRDTPEILENLVEMNAAMKQFLEKNAEYR